LLKRKVKSVGRRRLHSDEELAYYPPAPIPVPRLARHLQVIHV